jgi:diaminohydroxyphosphoribosylaminopyrimidine deaminase/5-amino-6-(5-phosphoribosylamino)uracil reductase
MQRALALAQRAQGTTSPNPPVGAVLVKAGRVVGEGFTRPPGQAHAEIVALDRAGDLARGAELYVTLEPCSHWGRTPPCSEALIAAGIASAHVALLDPNPRVGGEGIRRLQAAGIEVVLGECAAAAAELAEAHGKYTTEGMPFVTLLVDAPPDVTAMLAARSDAVLDAVEPGRLPHVLKELARQEKTSVLITCPTGTALLPTGLVDKIVAGPDVTTPEGFVLGRRVEQPSPHLALYRQTSPL